MPDYETDLCNTALVKCGIQRITSIDDVNARAQACKTLLPNIRKRALAAAYWTFADWRDELSVATGVTPEFEFTTAYLLPQDYVRLRGYGGAVADLSALDPVYQLQMSMHFKLEGQYLFTNDGEVKIIYTRDVQNPQLWSPNFFIYVATLLASELAQSIRKDEAKAQALLGEAMQVHLPMAAAIDAQQQPPLRYEVDDLLWGRF